MTQSEVLVYFDGEGLVLASDDESAVAKMVDRLMEGEPEASSVRRSAGDAVAGAGAAAGLLGAHQEYLRPTAEALAKLNKFGKQEDASGALRGWVMNDKKKFAGQLTFEQVSFNPEQALALQSAAATMALRTAIADLQATVERVEERVKSIQRLIAARQIGDVVGIYRMLDRIVRGTAQRGRLLDADWDAVAGVGSKIYSDIESLRSYLDKSLSALGPNQRLPKRAKGLEDLSRKDGARDALDLLVLAQQALHLWESLRLERIKVTEPEHLQAEIETARASMKEYRERDAALVGRVEESVAAIRQIDPLEIHRIFSSRDLQSHSDDVLTMFSEFATKTRTPPPSGIGEFERPEWSDTKRELKRSATQARDGAVALGRTARTLCARTSSRALEGARQSIRRDKGSDSSDGEANDKPADQS